MKIRDIIPILLVIFLAACSTTVNTAQPLPAASIGTLHYGAVNVTTADSNVKPYVCDELKQEIVQRLSQLPQGGTNVTIDVQITHMQITSGEERVLLGMLAGASTMSATVTVHDASGATLMLFTVDRSANPGIWGALSDERDDTIQTTANGIADTLAGRTAK
jgi:hypothetical protein